MTMQTSPAPAVCRQPAIPAFRAVRWLVGAYLGLSMLTVAAIITLSDIAPQLVNPQAWTRGIIVAATSVLTFAFANRVARGSQRALLRLRIAIATILVATGAVLLFLPLPLWMIIEQAVCEALLAAAAIIIFVQGGRATEKDRDIRHLANVSSGALPQPGCLKSQASQPPE